MPPRDPTPSLISDPIIQAVDKSFSTGYQWLDGLLNKTGSYADAFTSNLDKFVGLGKKVNDISTVFGGNPIVNPETYTKVEEGLKGLGVRTEEVERRMMQLKAILEGRAMPNAPSINLPTDENGNVIIPDDPTSSWIRVR